MKTSNRDADAIHKSAANEISGLAEKVAPHDDDVIVGEDSENGYVKKKFKKSAFGGTDPDALHLSVSSELAGMGAPMGVFADDLFYMEAASSGAPYKAKKSQLAGPISILVMAGFIRGLVLSHAADTDHDITIGPGTCIDLAGTQLLPVSGGFTKQIDAAWAVGNNTGGLFSGTVAADTWYHVFLIHRDSDGAIQAGFDTSVTAANIPAGYTAYRRVGSVHTDASANIYKFLSHEIAGSGVFTQWVPEHDVGDGYIWDVLTAAFSTTQTAKQLHAPDLGGSGAGSFAHLILFIDTTADRQVFLITPGAGNGGVHNNQNHIMGETGDENHRGRFVRVYADANGQINVRSNANGSGTYSIKTVGYEDSRS